MIEEPRCQRAFEIYYSLGPRRTYRGVCKAMGEYTHSTISKWSRLFNWNERVLEWDRGEFTGELAVTTKLRKDANKLVSTDKMSAEIEQLIYKVDIALNGFFKEDDKGNIVPTFVTTSAQDFNATVKSLKDLVLIHRELERTTGDSGKEKKSQKTIETMNVFFGNLTEEQKIAFLKGKDIEDTKSGNPVTSGGIQEADYSEISESEDTPEDGRGRDDIHHCSGESDTGDEG